MRASSNDAQKKFQLILPSISYLLQYKRIDTWNTPFAFIPFVIWIHCCICCCSRAQLVLLIPFPFVSFRLFNANLCAQHNRSEGIHNKSSNNRNKRNKECRPFCILSPENCDVKVFIVHTIIYYRTIISTLKSDELTHNKLYSILFISQKNAPLDSQSTVFLLHRIPLLVFMDIR